MTFDKWWNSYDNLQCDKDSCEDAYVSGQESKQDEVDVLQKRIDQALEKCYTGIRKQGGDYYLEVVQDILKGVV